MSQSLFLQNDPDIHEMLERRDGWLAAVDDQLTNATPTELDSYIEEAFLRTVSRMPTEVERQTCRTFLAKSESGRDGLQGILWALINSKEFCFNR